LTFKEQEIRITFLKKIYILEEVSMKITLSVLKADIGSIGGHITPSQALFDEVNNFVKENGKNLLIDFFTSHTGDWDAFISGTEVAKKQGLYGAGQDLLKDAFSGNIKGMGPAVAEMQFEERPNEPFLFFAADKTDPGASFLPGLC
jgi:fructose 1,6-bisphosphate aldolase/phosphatase